MGSVSMPEMIQLKQKDLKPWAINYLMNVQGGMCPLCKQPINVRSATDMVVDHDHETGEIRGVLHRSCNAAEGKINNLVRRWGVGAGATVMDCIKWLGNLVTYWQKQGTGFMYPGAASREQREAAAKLKRNKAAAAKRAAAKLNKLKGATNGT